MFIATMGATGAVMSESIKHFHRPGVSGTVASVGLGVGFALSFVAIDLWINVLTRTKSVTADDAEAHAKQ